MPAVARAQRSGQLTADSRQQTDKQNDDKRTKGQWDRHELATPHLSAFVLHIFQVLNYNLPLLFVVVVAVYCYCLLILLPLLLLLLLLLMMRRIAARQT